MAALSATPAATVPPPSPSLARVPASSGSAPPTAGTGTDSANVFTAVACAVRIGAPTRFAQQRLDSPAWTLPPPYQIGDVLATHPFNRDTGLSSVSPTQRAALVAIRDWVRGKVLESPPVTSADAAAAAGAQGAQFDPEVAAAEAEWLSEATLCRYLRARDWDVGKACAMLWETVQWRRDYGMYTYDVEGLRSELGGARPKMYVSDARDAMGHAVVINRKSKDPVANHELVQARLLDEKESCPFAREF